MAFLFQDQNQGTRNDVSHAKKRGLPQPFSFIRTLTVGFGIAPNLLTLLRGGEGARGLGLSSPFTAGGDFHPALRTHPPGMGGLFRIMTNTNLASKNLPYG
jgi:hypothetical protein